MTKKMKYIFVTGGVLSGLGKGITSSSIGCALKARGLKVTAIKIDPYINCDAGTMNPYQHGEVYVMDDGGEVDLDLGNYERFLDVNLTSDHNITTGKAYLAVIEKERRGDFLGKTVQIIPHVTNYIKDHIMRVSKASKADVAMIELGGTVGDIESMPFMEAARQLKTEVGDDNCLFIHTTLVPVMGVVGEQKTKPTQHSVKELRSIGIQPDVIVARGAKPLEDDIKDKISMFCDVPVEAVVSAPDAKSIYYVPGILEDQGLTDYILAHFNIYAPVINMKKWDKFVYNLDHPKYEVEIAIVGKYTHLHDSYISHLEALNHASSDTKTKINVRWVEAIDIEKKGAEKLLGGVDAVLIPGGFGKRGTEGKMMAAGYARENNIPFVGVCLGFQLAVIEFARNVLGLEGANSSEFDEKTPYPVIDLLPEQKKIKDKGATMRLGTNKIKLKKNTIAYELYGKLKISERHRHRFEVNPDFIKDIEKGGLRFTGTSIDPLDGRRMEVAELKDHPFYLATQFHPEFKSRPNNPSRVHLGLVKAAVVYNKAINKKKGSKVKKASKPKKAKKPAKAKKKK